MQGNRRRRSDLGALQKQIRDHGYDGAWADAVDSETKQGASGGVAVLAKTSIPVTSPPFLSSPVIVPGRLCAGHVRWGVRGGLILLSLYLQDSVGMCDFNRLASWHVAQYISRLQAAQHDCVVAGDFNVSAEVLAASRLHAVGAYGVGHHP